FLRARGVNCLSALLLTHGDLHHVGGFDSLAKDFSIAQVLTSSAHFRSHAYREIVQQLERQPQQWRKVHRGDRIGQWTFLHPAPADRYAKADDSAIVLLGEFYRIRVLLVSDLGQAGQRTLLERQPELRADLIVAGFPRGGEPLSHELLEVIQPRVILLAGAEFPSTAHASAKLCQPLDRLEIPVICTDISGAATIKIGPAGWELRTMRGANLAGRSSEATGSVQDTHVLLGRD